MVSCGCKPIRKGGGKVSFLSPLRAENDASFYVYLDSNSWHDYGSGKGGNIIDLVKELEGCGFVEAIEKLSTGNIPKVEYKEVKARKSPISITYTTDIKNEWLLRYITSRHIKIEIAKRFCVQVGIEITKDDKVYKKTCIGWKNNKGGYDFRNPRTKISNAPKWWTTVNPDKKTCYVFEGFMDFLSYLTMFKYNTDVTYIILNSVGMAKHIDWAAFDSILFFGDNDSGGNLGFDKINHPNKIDKRNEYRYHKDINDWLCAVKNPKRSLIQSIAKNEYLLGGKGW